jgi:hypothetical protein
MINVGDTPNVKPVLLLFHIRVDNMGPHVSRAEPSTVSHPDIRMKNWSI